MGKGQLVNCLSMQMINVELFRMHIRIVVYVLYLAFMHNTIQLRFHFGHRHLCHLQFVFININAAVAGTHKQIKIANALLAIGRFYSHSDGEWWKACNDILEIFLGT